MQRTRTPAIRGWLAGAAYHAVTVGPLFGGWHGFWKSLVDGALIALVPATLVFWVLWLPLRGGLARTSVFWCRRTPITLAAIGVFGVCGHLVGSVTTDSPDRLFERLDHSTVVYALVGFVVAGTQDPKEIVPAREYARLAFWICAAVAALAAVGVIVSVPYLSSDKHSVTTGMSSNAIGLMGLFICVPVLLVSVAVAWIFRGIRRSALGTTAGESKDATS